MSFAGRMNWLLFGDSPKTWKKLEQVMLTIRGKLDELDAVKAENKAMQDRVLALEIKHEELKGRTLGWQEGFGTTVRKQLRRIDKRISTLIASDDSSDCEMNRQHLEELRALRRDVSLLDQRVDFIEKHSSFVVPCRSPEPPAMPMHLPFEPYQVPIKPTRTVPEIGDPDPLHPPFKIICQTKEEACD